MVEVIEVEPRGTLDTQRGICFKSLEDLKRVAEGLGVPFIFKQELKSRTREGATTTRFFFIHNGVVYYFWPREEG